LAEEVLFDALKINAANPEIYMTLLGIFDTRGDAKGFEAVALKLKAIGDEATWQKAAEMGRKLDIGNELYA
jgi:pilus assembly protein FimV